MRVLMLTFDYPPHSVWGMGSNVKSLVDGLISLNHIVKVVTVNRFNMLDGVITTPCRYYIDNNLKYGKCICDIGEYSCLSELTKQVDQYIKKLNDSFDVLHCHGWMMWEMTQFLSEKYNLPTVVSIHFFEKQYSILNVRMVRKKSDSQRIERCEEKMFYNANLLVCPSHYAETILQKYYPEIKTDRMVIYHGVDILPMTNINKRSGGFLFVGRLCHEKGIDQLIEYFGNDSTVSLDVIGSGNINSFNRYENIHYIGALPQKQLFEQMRRYNFIILPYLGELFGLVLIEAVMCGCIPLIPSTGSFAEIGAVFQHIGFSMFENNILDKDSLASAIKIAEKLSPQEQQSIREKNYKICRNLFSVESMCQQYEKAYKKVIMQEC